MLVIAIVRKTVATHRQTTGLEVLASCTSLQQVLDWPSDVLVY